LAATATAPATRSSAGLSATDASAGASSSAPAGSAKRSPSATASTAAPADKSEVLDMEAEFIDKAPKAPALALDIDTSALDSTIYKRSEFNEFHAIDSSRRLRMQGPDGPKEPDGEGL
jgi:hypothetical protein